MSDPQPNIGASPTFEAGPSETIAGKEHQLVFVRAVDPMNDREMRYHALKGALDTACADDKYSEFSRDTESLPPMVDRVFAIAERYFAYMKDGSL